ncbi:MAG: hypothetical protein EOP87_15510 [Verrucomicrobiaceae bacterium]|nr:MAG: hypothetical protein EOP87_15510 [Verrucomicrobiaceae bacterium]
MANGTLRSRLIAATLNMEEPWLPRPAVERSGMAGKPIASARKPSAWPPLRDSIRPETVFGKSNIRVAFHVRLHGSSAGRRCHGLLRDAAATFAPPPFQEPARRCHGGAR